MTTATAMQYATEGERRLVRRLLAAVLKDGNTVSVHDGEAWAIKRSKDRTAIMAELAHTDRDYLHVTDADGRGRGGFDLIWGNDPDGSELIADHSDNTFCNEVWNAVHGRSPR